MTAPTNGRPPRAGDEIFPDPAEPRPARPSVPMHISGVYEGYPITIDLTASVDQVPALVARLRDAGIEPPTQPPDSVATPAADAKPAWNSREAVQFNHRDEPICPHCHRDMLKSKYDHLTWYCGNPHPPASAPVNKKGYCGFEYVERG